MSEQSLLAAALPVVGMGEELGLSWVEAHGLPGRVPPPTLTPRDWSRGSTLGPVGLGVCLPPV
jgi:hypothetical protein